MYLIKKRIGDIDKITDVEKLLELGGKIEDEAKKLFKKKGAQSGNRLDALEL